MDYLEKLEKVYERRVKPENFANTPNPLNIVYPEDFLLAQNTFDFSKPKGAAFFLDHELYGGDPEMDIVTFLEFPDISDSIEDRMNILKFYDYRDNDLVAISYDDQRGFGVLNFAFGEWNYGNVFLGVGGSFTKLSDNFKDFINKEYLKVIDYPFLYTFRSFV